MKDYKAYFAIPATPDEVYAALTNALSLELMTGEKAEMSTEVNSEFSLWDGSIVGKNLEFEENKKIVQQWYFDSETAESIVTLKFHPHKGSTSLELRQTNIPNEDYDDLIEGWNNVYIAALIEFFQE